MLLDINQRRKNEFRRIIKKHDKISKIYHIDDSDFPSNQIFYLRNRMVENAQRKYNFLTDERIDLIENLYKGKHAVIQLIYFHEKPICCNIFLLNSCNEFLTWINLFDNVKMINIFSYVSFIFNIQRIVLLYLILEEVIIFIKHEISNQIYMI